MTKKFALVIGMFVLLAQMACQKSIEPDTSIPAYSNELQLTVLPPDSTHAYYRVSFSRVAGTWDPAAAQMPVLYRFYRQYGGNDLDPCKTVLSVIDADSFGTRVQYRNTSSTRVDSGDVIESDTGSFIDMPDYHDYSELRYVAVSCVRMEKDSGAARFTGGYEGRAGYSLPLSAKMVARFSINNGARYTANNVVSLSASFDPANVASVRIYRYSAVLPLNKPDTLLMLSDGDFMESKNSDTAFHYKVVPGSGTSADSVFYIADKKNPGIRLFCGLLEDSKKIAIDSLDYTKDLASDIISFTRPETLPPGHGKKWIVLSRLNAADDTTGWPLMYGSLDIQPYNMLLTLDPGRPDDYIVDEFAKRMCVTSDGIPVFFYTYGDSTFEDTVYIWIATRKFSSRFYSGNKDGTFQQTSFLYSFNSLSWMDCIFETRPEMFQLDEFKQVKGVVLKNFNYTSGYRVSPFGVSQQLGGSYAIGGFSKVTTDETMQGFKRLDSDTTRAHLAYMVKKGSILGYDETALNAFKVQTVYGNSLKELIYNAPGWHDAVAFGSVQNQTLTQYVGGKFPAVQSNSKYAHAIAANFSVDNDGNFYQHPFRGIPVTSSDVSEGTKEFIILAYSKGKYFKEPRIAISRFSSVYSYVWDKIPPQFVWSIRKEKTGTYANFDPVAYPDNYAPMCNKSGCTDLSVLKGTMNVSLSPLNSFDKRASIRDVGFGTIRSARLLFNYHANYLKSDPLTGERTYLTPNIYYDLPKTEIDRESYGTYDDKIGASFCLTNVVFPDINISGWQSGTWDMWLETEDGLGNHGLAPHGFSGDANNGFISIRQFEIK